jgi:hypothetical protein
MSEPILQTCLPFAPWMDARTWRLPGVVPAAPGDWLSVDDAFAPQMAERDRLIAEAPGKVLGMLERARPAAEELLELVLARLRVTQGYVVGAHEVRRPDDVMVALERDQPIRVLGRLVQEDLCLLDHDGDESVLMAAALCFPASWTLAEKLGRPMLRIHEPVTHYSEDVAKRVQRLFDAIRPEQPLQRWNALVYDDPELHQPRLEGQRRPRPVRRDYLRSERQVLVRLPQTRAVVFSIHTWVVEIGNLDPEARDGMAAAGL